jgi:hypothetical protein
MSCLLLSSCNGFERETYVVPAALAAELRTKWGDDLEAMRVDLEKKWGVTVDSLERQGKNLRADLPPLILDVASTVATKTIEGVGRAQDPLSLIIAAVSAAAAGAGVATARGKVRKTAKKVPQ